MELRSPSITPSRNRLAIVRDSSVKSEEGLSMSTHRKQLKFIPFTNESYQRLLLWEAIEKRKEAERKERSQEAHLKDGELKFGTDEDIDKIQTRNPDLEEGKALKLDYGEPPAYYMGLPLEEVDKGITVKTFVVFSRWLNHTNISRFSAAPSFYLLSATSPLRRMSVYLCTNQIFDFFILFTILTNCICLAIPSANNVYWLEYVFFGIYSTEMVIKVLARGLFFSKYTYLRDPWNWLDMIVIASGIPTIILRAEQGDSSTNGNATQALRTFRVLRAVKTISIFPGLRTIVNAMLRAIKMLMEVVLLTMFCLLVLSLVSVQIYRGTLRQKCVMDPHLLQERKHRMESYDQFYNRMIKDPENWETDDDFILCGNNTGAGMCHENYTCQGNIGENPNFGFMNFDNVFWSALITFQLMTIDFWENAYRKVLLTNGYLAVIFFILTVFFGSFYLLNLMLAVVTITYQEEAEKTHREMESERADKRQRKQAVSAFYNMTTLATKQNVWAKLIKENKHKEKDRESPLQKLVRLRTAINIWQKVGHVQKMLVDPNLAVSFEQYATGDRTALDVLQNVAYCFQKWKTKTVRLHKLLDEKHGSRKLRFHIFTPPRQKSNTVVETAQTKTSRHGAVRVAPWNLSGNELLPSRDAARPSLTPREHVRYKERDKPGTSGSQSSFTSLDIIPFKTHQRFSMRNNSLRSLGDSLRVPARDARRGSDTRVLKVSNRSSLNRLPSLTRHDRVELVSKTSKLECIGEDKDISQNQNMGLSWTRHDREDEEQSHLISTISPRFLDRNINAQRSLSESSQPVQPENPDQQNVDGTDVGIGSPKSSDGETDFAPKPLPQVKMFTSFSQVGRQLLISAMSNMDDAQPPKDSQRAPWKITQMVRALLPTLRNRCAPAMKAIKWVGSSVQNMINRVVSDIFFELFITFCIVLNTMFMSLEYHGMTPFMEDTINTSGMVFTLIFDVEALLKITAYGFRGYFGSRWNRFDSIIALLSSVSVVLELTVSQNSKWLQFLRAFRLLRVLKLAQVWPAMNTLLTIIGNALSALGQLTIILGIILYIFAIIGLQLFKDKYQDYQFPNGIPRWNFTDFFHSFMLMFRVLCGEWIEPLWDCMRIKEVNNSLCMIVFFPTLIFGNFVVLNLFLALLLNAFGENPTAPIQSSEHRRLREAKLHIKSKFAWLGKLCCPNKEVHLIIHRPDHMKSFWPRLYALTAKSQVDSPPGSGATKMNTTTSPMSLLNSPSIFSGQPGVQPQTLSDTTTSLFISFKESKARRGATRTEELIQMKQVVRPARDKTAPPCFPKFILNRTFFKREQFNNSEYGKRWMKFRVAVMKRVQSDVFEYVVLLLIIISSMMLAFEDYEYQNSSEDSFLRQLIRYANYIFAVLFTVEMVLRWIAFGVTKYFTNAWTIIDFIVVVVSVMALKSTNIVTGRGGPTVHRSDLSAFRVLRAFRPLRVVSRIQGMKIVVNSLMRAIPAILNVFMVSCLFWLIFCVMGVQFFRGKFFKCISKASKTRVPWIKDKEECMKHPEEFVWYNSYINFDSVPYAFLALFQVATFEGWMEIMRDAVDSTAEDKQPRFEASLYTYLYFVAFIICGSFFSLNLVIGVIIDNFNVLKKKYEGSYLDGFLTPTQRNYYNTLKKMSTRKPQRIITPPRTRFQQVFYILSISDRFELLVMSVVFLNMIVLGVEYSQYKLPCAWYEALWVLDVGFCFFFILEATLKIVGLRMYYFTLPWNCYDFIVAILSFSDVAVHLLHQHKGIDIAKQHHDPAYVSQVERMYILSPIFLRLLRIFRISRVLRIIKVAKGLRKVIFSLVISLPAIINIMALLMLCLYIYAIFGMFLFSYVKLTGALTPMMNFRSFKQSALLLLSLSTAAGWNDILDPLLIAPPFCNETHHQKDNGEFVRIKGGDCGKNFMATPYMVSYIILTYLFIINMYIAVILENYNQAHQQDEVGVTEDDFDMFYSVWQRYDPHATQYIAYTQLSDFVADLDPPLGIEKPNEIALVSINLPILQGDRIHCLDILLALVRNVLTDIDESDEMFTLKQQINTKFRARFPSRNKIKMISTTIERKKEDVAARTLQRAWQVFKTQQAIQSIMKMTAEETQRLSSTVGRNPSSVEELTHNMALAYAHYFQHLIDGAAANRRNTGISMLSKSGALQSTLLRHQ